MRDAEEKLHPYARTAYEASTFDETPWEALPTLERQAWVAVADAVLTAYDDEWRSVRAGL